ncbi:hypothetical protein MATL_G00121080 [Megalops atlanticus]|uniref:Beta-defensin n=1 Tax=Megalops atlanticus TaxID=7932 RepID=A0A9D3PZS4_MEGAT|nr:hypothetical protein MATL_G00121080 [Megalops atlanticus]
MNRQRVMLLVMLIFMAFTSGQMKETVALPWGCSNYSGVCRPVCLPSELPFGPFGCAKGYVCCVAHIV